METHCIENADKSRTNCQGVGIWRNELSLGELRVKRERLLGVQAEDLLRVCEKYLYENLVRSDCIIGPMEALILEKNDPNSEMNQISNSKSPNWKTFKL